MTRRKWLSAVFIAPVMGTTVTARAGLHVSGTLTNDAHDLSAGYYLLCGAAQCKALDAIGISIHPDNPLYREPLDALVGRTVQVSIFSA